jgi:hypothetical protein
MYIYSKNFALTHAILCFYCIDLLTRIPKHLYLLFYDFSTIYYVFSKIEPVICLKKRLNLIYQNSYKYITEVNFF